MNQIDLRNRRAVVTGGAQGIGFAIADRLLRSGAAVALWDMNADLLKDAERKLAAAGKVAAVRCDVTTEASVSAAVAETAKALGGIDILVNNAGIAGPNMPLWEYPPDEWDRIMAINLRGVYLCCRAVAPAMRTQPFGRIVNIASIAGKEGNPNASAYSVSKAGVIALTKSLGKELAATPVRVNCITPAAVRTAIFDQMSEKHVEFMLSKIPMGRFGKVEEIAALVAWLASEDCSFTTGAVFDISGGRATY